MKRRNYLLLLLALALLLSACAGPAKDPAGPEPENTAGGEENAVQTAKASAQGYGGLVTVTVTLTGGALTEVAIDAPNETETIGRRAAETLREAMLEAKDVEVDGVAGATMTSLAVRLAAREALAQASGQTLETPDAVLEPGTYTNKVWGFSVDTQMEVSVTVSENEILSIEVGANGETEPILQSAVDLLIPRMIEHQSVAVDAITGATGSSAGIRQGVTLALAQALEAAGCAPEAIAAFQSVPEKIEGETQMLETEVLIIGMGGTGSAAAMAAAETQAAAGEDVSVLAIDKAGKYGGTSAVTSEMMAINPPRFMEDHDYEVRDIQLGVYERPLEDTRTDKSVYVVEDEMKEAWLTYTEGDAKEEMVDLMFDCSGETLDWLMYDHDFYFGKPQLGVEPTATYFCVYQYNDSFMDNKPIIATYFDALYDDYTALGGEYLLETEGYELLTGEAGEVIGAKARAADGTEYEIYADCVILATGGFAGNGEMTETYLSDEYYPLKGAWNQVGMTQNDGKMIQAAIDIGAGTYNIGMPPMVHIGGSKVIMHEFETRTVEVDGVEQIYALNDVPMIMAISGDVMTVDRYGKRFTDESGLGFLEPWKGGPEFYSIWSDDRVQQVKEQGFDTVTVGAFIGQGGVPAHVPVAELDAVIEAAIRAGNCYRADTLEELAEQIGVPAETLAATVEEYNGFCAAGVDEAFGKDASFLKPIGDSGPYYAFVGAPYAYSTCGGLDVNTDLQVLKTDGETPIGGLYAGGTDCLGVLLSDKKASVTYGGCAQGWAFTSGRLAGIAAAEDAMLR